MIQVSLGTDRIKIVLEACLTDYRVQTGQGQMETVAYRKDSEQESGEMFPKHFSGPAGPGGPGSSGRSPDEENRNLEKPT